MILEAIIPSLLPVAADGVRGVFNWITGGAGSKPANVEETINLMEAETKRLQVLAEIDKAEGVHTWVADIRALQRPVVSGAIIAGYIYAVASGAGDDTVQNIGAYAQMVTFYLFGDRTYMYFKKGK